MTGMNQVRTELKSILSKMETSIALMSGATLIDQGKKWRSIAAETKNGLYALIGKLPEKEDILDHYRNATAELIEVIRKRGFPVGFAVPSEDYYLIAMSETDIRGFETANSPTLGRKLEDLSLLDIAMLSEGLLSHQPELQEYFGDFVNFENPGPGR